MRELTTSNTDADATMETGVEERDSYYSNYAHHGIHEEMLKVILHCVCVCVCDCLCLNTCTCIQYGWDKGSKLQSFISSAAISKEIP